MDSIDELRLLAVIVTAAILWAIMWTDRVFRDSFTRWIHIDPAPVYRVTVWWPDATTVVREFRWRRDCWHFATTRAKHYGAVWFTIQDMRKLGANEVGLESGHWSIVTECKWCHDDDLWSWWRAEKRQFQYAHYVKNVRRPDEYLVWRALWGDRPYT